jgi:hypothetical protein
MDSDPHFAEVGRNLAIQRTASPKFRPARVTIIRKSHVYTQGAKTMSEIGDVSPIIHRIEERRSLRALRGHTAKQFDPRLAPVADRRNRTNASRSLSSTPARLNRSTQFPLGDMNYPNLFHEPCLRSASNPRFEPDTAFVALDTTIA